MSHIGHDGGPAFPLAGKLQKHEYGRRSESVSYVPEGGQAGMSLRDYFAAKALPQVMDCVDATLRLHKLKEGTTMDDIKKHAALDAYSWADAMLAARKGKSK